MFLQVCSQTGVLRTLHTENVLVQYKTNALVILTATKIVIINVALMAAGDFAERKLVCRGGREGNTDWGSLRKALNNWLFQLFGHHISDWLGLVWFPPETTPFVSHCWKWNLSYIHLVYSNISDLSYFLFIFLLICFFFYLPLSGNARREGCVK